MKRFLIIVEESGTAYSAYSPDVPSCVSTGSSREEVEQNMREAIEFHLEGLPTPETQPAQLTWMCLRSGPGLAWYLLFVMLVELYFNIEFDVCRDYWFRGH